MQNATEELERLERAFDSVKKQLFTRLHAVARQQLFQQAPEVRAPGAAPAGRAKPWIFFKF